MGIAVVPLVAKARAFCSAFTHAHVPARGAVSGEGTSSREAATGLRPKRPALGYAAAIWDALEGWRYYPGATAFGASHCFVARLHVLFV